VTLLHLVLCQNREGNNDFDIADVCNEIYEKLIHRHPIFIAIQLFKMKKK
jgi:uncharacterized protein YabN with tetrapyrrole methylase and pyrophosphatase domain